MTFADLEIGAWFRMDGQTFVKVGSEHCRPLNATEIELFEIPATEEEWQEFETAYSAELMPVGPIF